MVVLATKLSATLFLGWDLPSIWKNKILSDTYWKDLLIYMKVIFHRFSEPHLEYNQDQTPQNIKGPLWPS